MSRTFGGKGKNARTLCFLFIFFGFTQSLFGMSSDGWVFFGSWASYNMRLLKPLAVMQRLMILHVTQTKYQFLHKRAHRHTPDLATQEPSASGVGTRGALTAPRPCCGYGYCVLTWQAPALKCRLGVACGGVAEFSACAICCSIYFQVSR